MRVTLDTDILTQFAIPTNSWNWDSRSVAEDPVKHDTLTQFAKYTSPLKRPTFGPKLWTTVLRVRILVCKQDRIKAQGALSGSN